MATLGPRLKTDDKDASRCVCYLITCYRRRSQSGRFFAEIQNRCNQQKTRSVSQPMKTRTETDLSVLVGESLPTELNPCRPFLGMGVLFRGIYLPLTCACQRFSGIQSVPLFRARRWEIMARSINPRTQQTISNCILQPCFGRYFSTKCKTLFFNERNLIKLATCDLHWMLHFLKYFRRNEQSNSNANCLT